MFPPLHSFRLQLVAATIRFSNLDLYPHSHASVLLIWPRPLPLLSNVYAFRTTGSVTKKKKEVERVSIIYHCQLIQRLSLFVFCCFFVKNEGVVVALVLFPPSLNSRSKNQSEKIVSAETIQRNTVLFIFCLRRPLYHEYPLLTLSVHVQEGYSVQLSCLSVTL